MEPIFCSVCTRRFEVSSEDPDAGMDDAFSHVWNAHHRNVFDEPDLLTTSQAKAEAARDRRAAEPGEPRDRRWQDKSTT